MLVDNNLTKPYIVINITTVTVQIKANYKQLTIRLTTNN